MSNRLKTKNMKKTKMLSVLAFISFERSSFQE